MSNPYASSRCLGWIALAALGAAGASATQRPLDVAVEVELTSARPGEALAAGGRALLAWRTADALPDVEEWEAFLSYDGGATWPIRLTPHLGVDQRRVAVELPPVAAQQARLLLRFGDERDERELEMARPFTIAPASPDPLAATPVLASGRGEAARPGLAGVVWWVDGDRDGGALVRRAARTDGFAAGAPAIRDAEVERAASESVRAPTLPRPLEQAALSFPLAPRAGTSAPARAPAATGRRLALLSRRNS